MSEQLSLGRREEEREKGEGGGGECGRKGGGNGGWIDWLFAVTTIVVYTHVY